MVVVIAVVLLTGSTGFVGAAALRALLRRPGVEEIRAVVHRRPPTIGQLPRVRHVHADLTAPETLAGICDGVDTLIHLAGQIGGSRQSCQAVNELGTAALLKEAQRSGVRRILGLSTAAVYGEGVHRGLAEDEVAPRPVSPTSRSRLGAERLIHAAGGTILRPMFITGAGDTWFLPTLLGLTEALNAWVDAGRALLSTIHVDELAEVIATLAGMPLPGGGVYHAADPCPRRVRDLIVRHSTRPLPTADVSLTAAEQLLSAPFTSRQLRLLFSDHWYDSSKLWHALGGHPLRCQDFRRKVRR